jgi:large subunit ribosomal protein L15
MGTNLQNIAPKPGANVAKKRLGRGHGSGLHKTSGKGTKGQKARTGHHGIPKPGFEGGQTAMARRLPKRGFINPFRKEVFAVNLGDIAARFTEAGASVDLAALKSAGLVPRSAKHVKVLGSIAEDQKLAQKLALHAHFISASAKEKLEAAGGAFHAIQAKASKPAQPA